jgi:hypothetical protein
MVLGKFQIEDGPLQGECPAQQLVGKKIVTRAPCGMTLGKNPVMPAGKG